MQEKIRIYWMWLSLTLFALCVSCASDNIHQPEPDMTPDPQKFIGTTASGIPIFPTFVPQISENYAVVNWLNPEKTVANIEMGEFSVDIQEVQMHIEIGTMLIKDIPFQKIGEDNYSFVLDEFNCQAGAYNTTGSIVGKLQGDEIEFTVLYYPGSMPFQVETIFKGTY